MPTHVPGFASDGPADPFHAFAVPRRDLRADDVRIDVAFCGVCGTDLHLARDEWGKTTYPIVPGHEIVGRVAEVGPRVTQFGAGDIVAVGCTVSSCGECVDCAAQQEQNCAVGRVSTYNSPDPHMAGHQTYGGYSQQVLVSERFVLRVPAAIADLARAAPIACAGVTTWAPLRRFKAGPGTRVGIVGLGGLGHLGVKIAVALGCEVTVITHTEAKTAAARELGASHVVVSTDSDATAAAARSLDLMLDTVPQKHAVAPLLALLRQNGALVVLGYFGPLADLGTPSVIYGNKILTGSFIGGQQETQDVFDFCAEHGILADVDVLPLSSANEALRRMETAEARFRCVLDVRGQ